MGLGFEIRIRKKPIPDPGVKKAPGPAALESFIVYCTVEETNWPELL